MFDLTLSSYNNVFTLLQPLNLVYRIHNFETFSLVIKVAIDGKTVELDAMGVPMTGLIFDSVEGDIVKADLIKVSAIIKPNFFLFKDLYFF